MDKRSRYDPSKPTEKAYRTGFHQAVYFIDRYIHDNPNLDPASVLDVARNKASSLRRDSRDIGPMGVRLWNMLAQHFDTERYPGSD